MLQLNPRIDPLPWPTHKAVFTMTLLNRLLLCLVALATSCVWFAGAFVTIPVQSLTTPLRVRCFNAGQNSSVHVLFLSLARMNSLYIYLFA
jgi:hypothetical protein